MVKCLVLREKIIELHKCGLSNAAIGKRLLEAKGTVKDIVHHWKTTGYPNKKALIKALMKAWDDLSSETIRTTCVSVPKRLEAMVKNEGGYVE